SPQNFYDSSFNEYIYLGIMLGFMFVMLGYNLFLYLSLGTKDYLYYIFYITTFICTQTGTQGIGVFFQRSADHNWFMNEGYLFFVNACIIGALLFGTEFLNFDQSRKINGFLLKMLRIGLVPPFFSAIYVLLSGNYKISTILSEWNTIILMPILLISGIIRMFHGYRPAFYFVAAWIFMLTGTLLIGLRAAGIVQSSLVIDWGQLTGGAIEVVLLSLALGYRLNLIRSQARKQIDQLNSELKKHIENVETIVEERTATINTILSHVDCGLLLVGSDKMIQPGFSKSCLRLFSTDTINEMRISNLLDISGNAKVAFDAAIDQIFEDSLPEEASLRQLPRHIKVKGRILALNASLVRDRQDKIQSILMTMLDETELHEAQLVARSNSMLLHILRHIDSFRIFSQEFKRQILHMTNCIKNGSETDLRMILHTLKGNTASFFIEDVFTVINKVENLEKISIADIDKIDNAFDKFIEKHAGSIKWIAMQQSEKFEVDAKDFHELNHNTYNLPSIDILRNWIDSWLYRVQLKPISHLIGPIAEISDRIARRLNKVITFEIMGEGILVNRNQMSDILHNITHLIRNAIDHGIHKGTIKDGKPYKGIVKLVFSETDTALLITVEDNGRGVDVEKVVFKALEKGLVRRESILSMSPEDRLNLVFMEGLSTKDEKSSISGHGLGMSAVKKAVEQRNGTITIFSQPEIGCRVEIEVPKFDLISEEEGKKRGVNRICG
ncbi:MAG: hypothetical protein HQK54_09420, partial [Oligoflexales bacterium]|nr:hypothetical protein [Oligoflexales bacterium]